MYRYLFILLAVFACLAFSQESDVIVLDSDNFDEAISENEFIMVEFYAPWCGHCKKLAPDYEKLATKLKDESSPAKVAKIDATEHSGPAQQYGVRGYPTLIFFKNGNQIKYEGDRSVDAMASFINKKSGPASLQLNTVEELEKFKKQDVVVAYLSDEESTEFKNWMRAATSGSLEDFVLGHVFDSTVAGSNAGKVVIHKVDDEDVVYPEDKITKTKLVKWITAEGYPLYEEVGQPVWVRAQSARGKLLVVFLDNKDKEQMDLLLSLAKQFKSEGVTTTFAPTSSQKQLAERWGASGRFFPTAVLADFKEQNPTMTIFDEENEKQFDKESGAKFVRAAIDGTYKSYMKSEPIPENNDGALTVVVGKTFEKIVYDNDKDVFVEFYAPWCGHCKKLAPTWEELAETFKDQEHVVISKIDATANNLPPEVKVNGYPTLIFFPAGGKSNQIPYDGERDLDSLTKFVMNKSSKEINLAKEDL